MRIAHVVATFPPQIGGMGQVAYEEAIRLAEIGHDVTIFTLSKVVQSYPRLRVVRLFTPLKFGDAGLVPQLLWRLKGFDVVHLHYPWYGGAEWVALAAKLFGIKYIVTYHMDASPVGALKTSIQQVYDQLFPVSIFHLARKVIAVDKQHAEMSVFGKQIDQKKMIELVNGVDTAIFTPDVRLPFPEIIADWHDKKIFLFVGNPLPFKRLDFILHAFAELRSPDAVLVIIGEGYGMAKYQRLAKELEVENRVRFVGAIRDRALLNRFYQAASALIVAAAKAESFSLVAIEALSAGCPVIASDIPGVRGRITADVDGVLFNPTSLFDLTRAITMFASHSPEKRATMGAAGRLKIIGRYSWNKHVSDLLNIYRSV